MKIAIIIPIRDDLRVIQRVQDITEGLLLEFSIEEISQIEITVVDDGFSQKIKTHLSEMKIDYISKKTKGKGGAVKYGLKNIDANHYLILDSDSSIEINAINSLIKIINRTNNVDLIYGVRIYEDVIKLRRLIGICQLILANILILKNFIQDTQCPLKCISRKLRDCVIKEPWINGGMYDIILFFICDHNSFKRLSFPVYWVDNPSILKIHKIILGDLIDIALYRIRFYFNNKYFLRD